MAAAELSGVPGHAQEPRSRHQERHRPRPLGGLYYGGFVHRAFRRGNPLGSPRYGRHGLAVERAGHRAGRRHRGDGTHTGQAAGQVVTKVHPVPPSEKKADDSPGWLPEGGHLLSCIKPASACCQMSRERHLPFAGRPSPRDRPNESSVASLRRS